MALFKPAQTSSNTSGFLGVQEVTITNFENKFEKFSWADVYIEVELNQKNSQYTKLMRIAGSFDFEADGRTIKGGSVLRRVYNLMEAGGRKVGISTVGCWEDENGNGIDNITKYLSENFAASEPIESYPYLAYIYKEKNPKSGKIFTTVYPKLWRNDDVNKVKMESDIKWLKDKNIIKEYIETVSGHNDSNQSDTALNNTGIDAL